MKNIDEKLKVYKIVPVSELQSMDYNLLTDTNINETRKSVDGTRALVEYKNEISDGFTNDEIIEIVMNNYDFWNEDTTT